MLLPTMLWTWHGQVLVTRKLWKPRQKTFDWCLHKMLSKIVFLAGCLEANLMSYSPKGLDHLSWAFLRCQQSLIAVKRPGCLLKCWVGYFDWAISCVATGWIYHVQQNFPWQWRYIGVFCVIAIILLLLLLYILNENTIFIVPTIIY